MKLSTLFTLLFATLTTGATAQTPDSTSVPDASSHLFVSDNHQAPQYPGGLTALKEFLTKNVKYPDEARKYGVEGRVVMTFFVNEDGTLSDISAHDCRLERFNTTRFSQETESRQKELKEQFAKLFAKEGARVIRKMPKWKPGKIDGKVVRARCNQPIRFSIPDK